MRVVSLIASSTEIICALGYGDRLVGRSHECDFPAAVRALPVVTQPKFKVEGSSREIDDRIRHLVKEGLSVYRVDPEWLERLKPDLIVTQVQCEVCAVSQRDVEEAVCQLVSTRPRIVSLNPNALDDVWTDIRTVAEALQAHNRGEELVASLRGQMKAITDKAATAGRRPRVAYIEWIEPLMTGGNWMPTLVEMAGGENLFGKADVHSPLLKWEDLVAADPDVLFISPCGFDLERTSQEMRWLESKAEWKSLKAVRASKVFLADGNQFFNRPGPRLVESLEILAETLHPELFPPRHENSGWRRFV